MTTRPEVRAELDAWIDAVEHVEDMRSELATLEAAYEPLRLAQSHKPKTPEFWDLCEAINRLRRVIGEHEIMLGLRSAAMVTVEDNKE